MRLQPILVLGLVAFVLAGCDSGEKKQAESAPGAQESAMNNDADSASESEKPSSTEGAKQTQVADAGTPTGAADAKEVKADSKISKAEAKKGQELFEENCVACHQADAIGKPGIAPSLTNPELLATASDKFFIETIAEGRDGTGMPPFSHLEKPEIKSIVAFLRAHSDEPNLAQQIDAEPDAHGDPRLGKLWFDNICSTCHGVQGSGYESGGTGTAIGKAGFLNKASDGFIRTTIRNGRSNTRMRGFRGPGSLANLSDREIDDIIVYMRTLSKNTEEVDTP